MEKYWNMFKEMARDLFLKSDIVEVFIHCSSLNEIWQIRKLFSRFPNSSNTISGDNLNHFKNWT